MPAGSSGRYFDYTFLIYGNLSASDTDSDVADSGHQDQCVETAVHKEVEIFQKIARSCWREAKQATREGREYRFDLLDWYYARLDAALIAPQSVADIGRSAGSSLHATVLLDCEWALKHVFSCLAARRVAVC